MDYDTVEFLKLQDIGTIENVSGELLEWIQDMNWPVASGVLEILLPLDTKLVPGIKGVFSTNDLEWMYNCLDFLVSKFSDEAIMLLHDDLTRLASIREEDFVEYEIPQVSAKLLSRLS